MNPAELNIQREKERETKDLYITGISYTIKIPNIGTKQWAAVVHL